MSDSGPLYNSYVRLILINVAFQVGFCTFVLSNYMKTLPHELTEAAMVDGASCGAVLRLALPLCRARSRRSATLVVTWVYNDFFWAVADPHRRQAADHVGPEQPPGAVLRPTTT